MSKYEVTNVSRNLIHDDLPLKDAHGKPVVLTLGIRQRTTLSEAAVQTPVVQRHLQRKRIRVRKIS